MTDLERTPIDEIADLNEAIRKAEADVRYLRLRRQVIVSEMVAHAEVKASRWKRMWGTPDLDHVAEQLGIEPQRVTDIILGRA